MSHASRPAKAVFPLIVTAALLLPAMLHAATLDAQKWDAVVRCADAAHLKADDSLRKQSQGAHAVLEAHLQQQGAMSDILLVTSGVPECKPVLSTDGQELVIDLPNTIAVCIAGDLQQADDTVVKSAVLSQVSVKPEMTARLTLQLARPCSYGLEQLKDGVVVHLTPTGESIHSPLVTVRMDSVHAQLPGVGDLAAQLEALQLENRTEEALAELAVAREKVSAEIATRRVSEKQDAIGQMLQEQRVSARVDSVAEDLKAIAAPGTQLGRQRAALAALGAADTGEYLRLAQADIPEGLLPEEAAIPADDVAAGDAAAEEAPAEGAEATPTEPSVEEAQDATPPPAPREEVAPPRPTPEEGQRGTRALTEELRKLIRTDEVAPATEPAPGSIQPALAPQASAAAMPAPQASASRPTITGDPMQQIVNIDFREMELANVVAILAHKAGINIIAGTELTGTVTANLHNVTLRQAMETVLRMNDLGIIEEEGIFRIVPYEEAVAAKRVTEMVELSNAKTEDMMKVLDDIIVGLPDARLVSIAANEPANVIVISGPKGRVDELVALAKKLDVAEPVLPTITEAIKLNYSEPAQLQPLVTTMLTPDIGQVAVDTRASHLVITDLPVVVEQVRELIKTLDLPVRQVSIEAMVVDAVMQDDAETGVDWVLNSIRRQSRRGDPVSELDDLVLDTNLPLGPNPAGELTFGILTSEFDIRGMIQAEVRNENGNLLSNPVLVTVENVPAKISIAEEIPYIELTQTNAGGSQTNTEFKSVGTILEVTPKVTHDDHIIVDISGKESNTAGEFNGIPIEQKREIETTLRVRDGQTIFIGGLRKDNDSATIRKVPILGDIPVVNFMFRNNIRNNSINELLIFLTCKVLPNDVPPLNAYQEAQHDKLESQPLVPNAQAELFHDMVYPGETRDPIWKYRRSE